MAARWYLRYNLSDCDVEELLVERRIEADHVTVYRWVQRFTRCWQTPAGGPGQPDSLKTSTGTARVPRRISTGRPSITASEDSPSGGVPGAV